MGFGEAISTCFSKYVVFTGRARRSEYWFFYLFFAIAYVVAAIVDAILGIPVFTIIAVLGLLLPIIAVGIRRLHDTGRAGWWILIGLIPIIGGITLIVFYCQDSDGENRYGPSPKWVPQRTW